MNCYVKYLLRKFEEVEFNHVVVKHMLVDRDGHIVWLVDNKPGCKKCSFLGCGVFDTYYVSSSNHMHGSAIRFEDNWKSFNTETFDIKYPLIHGSQMLESFFFQMMAMTEKQHIYLRGQKFFEKGSAYQHMMQAELTCS